MFIRLPRVCLGTDILSALRRACDCKISRYRRLIVEEKITNVKRRKLKNGEIILDHFPNEDFSVDCVSKAYVTVFISTDIVIIPMVGEYHDSRPLFFISSMILSHEFTEIKLTVCHWSCKKIMADLIQRFLDNLKLPESQSAYR